MEKELFFVSFGSTHWCGCDESVLVYAETEEEAIYLSEDFRADTMRSLLSYDEEVDIDYDEEEFYLDTVYLVRKYDGEVDGPIEWYEVVGDPSKKEYYPDDDLDGDAESALRSVGWGTDEDYLMDHSD